MKVRGADGGIKPGVSAANPGEVARISNKSAKRTAAERQPYKIV